MLEKENSFTPTLVIRNLNRSFQIVDSLSQHYNLASVQECEISEKSERLRHSVSIQEKCIKDETLDKAAQLVESLSQIYVLDSVQERHISGKNESLQHSVSIQEKCIKMF